ncbi:hypothetical protein HJC23_004229 [Cyclotella cryptica]|uniref:Uncharacterized protein n=1 Tax=Cyclotella cryptica TaxID=29204 RepID=A0ABD3Q8M8_9STRA|eukprot:CCRYP_007875-RA/>CCRYP_007875-RA protein AED:0.24 eAED:0.24 QI:0/-1/0/1/-1/1/1/0/606
MTQHQPQHLLLTLAILPLPLTAPHPLYQHYNLTPRNLTPPHHSAIDHHRLLLLEDDHFQFDLDLSTTSQCTSPLIEWSMDHVREMGYAVYKELYDNQILQMPYIYKHFIDRSEEDESFGYDGSETLELIQRHRDTMAFWTEADVDDTMETEGILLLSMHGRDLMDNEKLVPTIIHMFDFENDADVLLFADKVREYIEGIPGGYDNPLLTMNAVATRGGRDSRNPSSSSSSRTVASLIIGDGVLQFVTDAGLTSSGPDFVHAHEFGHHLQYEMDLAHNVPEGYENDIRRKELMADAISAYFLAHDRGGNMDAHEISEFAMTAFATGDCNVGQEDHHGTPKQRYCSSVWGASRAALAKDGSQLIDPETFVDLFNAAYGGILDLDDGECTLILEEPDDDVNYVVVSEPETSSNFDTTGLDTSNADTSAPDSSSPARDFRQDDSLSPEEIDATEGIPTSAEAVFSFDKDYKATDGSSTSSGGGYPVLDGYEITALPDATEQPANSESSSFKPLNGSPASTGLVAFSPEKYEREKEQVTGEADNESFTLVAGRPSETELHFGMGTSYRCNLPWVYCSDEFSSSGRKHGYGTFHRMAIIASCVAALVNSLIR